MDVTAPTSDFARRLLERREQLGLSLEELADRITAAGSHVQKNAVWKWEKAKARPTREKLPAIAMALDLDEDTVVGWWAGIDPESATIDDEQGLRVIARYDGKPLDIPPRLRRQLELLVESELEERSD